MTRTLAGLILDQKIGQLLFLHDSDRIAVPGSWTDSVVRQVAAGRAGGLYPGPLQLRSAHQSAELNNRLQSLAPIPLLVAADLEAGLGYVMQKGATDFPMQMGLGATRSAELVSQITAVVAREARAVGINTYFGPVLDVNVNPRNPIIATRSFGESAELVTSLGLASLESAQRGGLLCLVKHFPGHGDTDVDSHRAMPTSSYSWERLLAVELVRKLLTGDKQVIVLVLGKPLHPGAGTGASGGAMHPRRQRTERRGRRRGSLWRVCPNRPPVGDDSGAVSVWARTLTHSCSAPPRSPISWTVRPRIS